MKRTMRNDISAWLLALVGVLSMLSATYSRAQSSFGSLVGNVSDSTGAAIPGAEVTLTNVATSEKRNTTSNATGDYQLLSLPPGEYSLTVSGAGFKRFTQSPIEVLVAQTTRLEVKLEIGQVTEQVEVTASAPIIQADNATLGQVVQGKAVQDMPLNGRNVLALVGLIPGVVMQGGGSGSTNGSNSGGNLTGQNVFAAGNFQISGGQANQSTTLVDGSPVNITYGHATVLVPSQDSVQEFKVQTSSNTAEFGMYTGGVVNMATKSGSNAIHGTAFEFLRNTVLNATPWLSKHNPSNILAKPPYHQNQFGANIGFPILKDHVFGFFDYQGYRQTTSSPSTYSVPTAKMRTGDFSELTASNQVIYDPCPGAAPPNCPTTARTAFTGNIIPAGRINSVAKAMLATAFPLPNQTGTGSFLTNNYGVNARSGGNNDQYTGRIDWTVSSKQRVFGRYTRWNSVNIADTPFHNGQLTPNPEKFSTNQTVLGDTYLFNQSLIGDLRISYLRYNYGRTPGTAGFDPTSIGLPAYYSQIGQLDGVPNNFPGLSFGGNVTYNQIGEQAIYSINNNYVISPSISKTWKNHTIKGGADLRRLEWQFYQNNLSGGNFSFTNAFTAANATASSGNPFASFLLGYPSGANIQISPKTFDIMYYQGYYVSDNWIVTRNLTATIGLRWEIPGVHVQRQDKIADFNPTEVNPVLGSIVNSITGQPVVGAFDLVKTSQLPIRGNHYEHFSNFSPRVGIAYRVNDKTVFRAGFGKFVVPNDVQFTDGSPWNPVNSYTNVAVTSTNNNVTPGVSLSNAFPNGFVAAPGRSSNYQAALLGNAINNAVISREENGLAYQWNVAVQRQMWGGIALEVAYAGSHGSHLPVSLGMNQVTEGVMAQAASDPNCNNSALLTGAGLQNCFMTKSVTTAQNPFYGKVGQGTVAQLNQQPIAASNFYRPFPQYGNISVPSRFVGVSNYNGLQMKAEKRFPGGGVLLGSYSFSKFMGNAETLTSWLDTTSGFQDFYNLGKEYALSNNDARQQLVVSYVYALPFGRGQRWGSGVTGITDKVVSGWGVNGTTTFREGFPLGFTMSTNNLSTYAGQGTERPDVVAGCSKKVDLPIQKRLGANFGVVQPYFNTACFVAPGSSTTTQTNLFLYGNETRVDAALRAPGIANYDLALYKDTHVTERVAVQFRIESFNLFNRVQFGAPNTAVGNSLYGQISAVSNQPRLLQFGGRLNF
jgi:hypothetical protein